MPLNTKRRLKLSPGPHSPSSEAFTRAMCKAALAPDWAYHGGLLLLERPMGAAISAIMNLVGEAATADRAWMFEYDEELLHFRNTHEWTRPGVSSFVDDLQDAPVAMIGWLHRFLVSGEAVMINRAGGLPRTARALRAELLRQGVESALCVPVFHKGRLRACIGFDAVRPYRWSGTDIKGLFQCADLIAAARYGKHTGIDAEGGRFAKLIYLRKHGRVVGTSINTIVGLRSAGDFAEVWLADGSKVLDQRPLAQWMAMTSRSQFVRIHRTAIVNLKYVGEIDRRSSGAWQLRLQFRSEVWPLSRGGRAELRVRLGV